MNWILKVIKDLQSRKFYGKLTVNFENGRITRAVKEESIKP